MEDCIFCKIAKNEESCFCVYEDTKVKAFLDANPWTEGHTLVIPKKHYQDISDISEEEFNSVMNVVRKLSSRYREIFECDINLIHSSGKNAQQDIFHFHIHLIPRYESDGQKINLKTDNSLKESLSSIFDRIKTNLFF